MLKWGRSIPRALRLVLLEGTSMWFSLDCSIDNQRRQGRMWVALASRACLRDGEAGEQALKVVTLADAAQAAPLRVARRVNGVRHVLSSGTCQGGNIPERSSLMG